MLSKVRALLFIFIGLMVCPAARASDAEALSRKLDRLWRADSSQGRLTMTIVTPDFQRTLVLRVWSRGLEDGLARIDSPAKEKGTASLKKGNTMWNYLPKIKKTIRVPPSMMMASWMGSDFTNDDLMRETSWEKDYTVAFHRKPPAGQIGLVYVPRPGAPVTYSKVEIFLDARTELPVSQLFYDEKKRLVRRMVFSNVKTMGGRTFPTKLELLPLSPEKKGHLTTVEYQDMTFNLPLKDTLFSLSGLQKDQ